MLDDEEGGSGLQELMAAQQSCCSLQITASIFQYELKSGLVPDLHIREEEVELEKSADPTSVLLKR
jgi:hypothetical protein